MRDELESWVKPVKRTGRTGPVIRPSEMNEDGDFEATVTTIWFDPGVKTGWAVFNVWREAMELDSYPILGNVASWSAGWFTGTEYQIVNQMMDLVNAWSESSHVGYEDFILLRLTGGRELLSPVRISARFQDRMDLKNAVHEVRGEKPQLLETPQSPSLMNSTVGEDRLRRWGFYASLPGEDNSHARDAVGHCITWLKRTKDAWRKERESGDQAED